ncbi:MAG: fibronectin type III domain-containing protein [Isosphaeraceae bacterium]
MQPLSDTQVALFWKPLPRAVEYLVQKAQVTTQAIKVHNRLVYKSQTGPWTTVAAYSNSTLSTVLNGLRPSTSYQFNVITVGPHAQFPGIPRPVRTMDVLIPDPGSFTLQLSKVTSSQVSLSWSASKGANGYTVWGFTDAILNLLSTSTSTTTTITGLASHTSYTFIVSAQSSAAGNVWSNNLVTTTTL